MKDVLQKVIITNRAKLNEPWEKFQDIMPFEPSDNLIYENVKSLFEEELDELRGLSIKVTNYSDDFRTCW